MKINDKMIIKCNNAEEYSWLINELDKEDIFIFAIDPEHCMGIPERINGREVNWDNKSYEKWFHDRRYFSIRSDFKLVHVMYQDEALGLKLMANYPIIEAKRLMEEKEMKENVKYTDVYKKVVKCLVRTDIIPWENCGVIGTIPYKEAINDLEGTILKVGDYVKVVDIRNEESQIVTSIIIDNGNRLVPYCNKDYDGNKDILLIKVGEFPTYSNTMDPETKEPSFVLMGQHEFDKQALAYYKAQYENTLSKLEVLQKKYDNSYRIQISLENTNELLKRKIEKMEARMNTMYKKSCMDKKPSVDELSDKELTKAFINRLFGVESAKNDIKDGSIIHCKSKEEAEWFFNTINSATSMEYFEIYDSCMGVSYNRPYIFGLFDDAPCVKNSGLYFKYTYRPLKVVLVDIDETDRPEDVLEASDLMKQEVLEC